MKKIFAFMVTLCAACMAVVMPVSAGNGPNPHPDSYAWVLVNNNEAVSSYPYHVQADKISSVKGMSYDKATNTLTLNGFNDPEACIVTNEMGDDFTIKVTGTNHIQQIYAWGYGYGGSVTLTGTGELVINENKQVESSIYLQAEGASAQVKIASGLTLKAYNQTGCPSVYIDYSSAAKDGIVFEDNASMNQQVAKTTISTAKSCSSYRTDNTISLYPCTPKNTSDTATYGAGEYLDDNYESYYKFFKIINISGVGMIAKPATDPYGEPLSPEDFDIVTNSETHIDAVDTSWRSYLGIYTKEGDSAQYGCYNYSIVGDNGEIEGESYNMYRLVEVDNTDIYALFAVPIENEQNLKEMPEGYTPSKGNDYYSYTYDEAINIGAAKDPCAKGHTKQTAVTKATTLKDGKIVTTCSVCKKELSSIVIPKVTSLKLSASSYTYNGKVKTPSVTVKDSKGTTLKKDTDYTVSYAKGRKSVGQYAVTISFTGSYSGTESLTFTINPKKTSLSSVKAKKKAIVVKWKKQAAQTTGYQIQYSTDKNFKKNTKTVTVSKSKTTSKTISKLKAKKKYYVRIRTYKTVKAGGKNKKLYSSWSSKKSVTTKK